MLVLFWVAVIVMGVHVLMQDMYNPWSPNGLYQQKALENWFMVIPEKAASVSLTTLRATVSGPVDSWQ